jgi:DsbC/DsbD-like thiol-disulfide interchange protein
MGRGINSLTSRGIRGIHGVTEVGTVLVVAAVLGSVALSAVAQPKRPRVELTTAIDAAAATGTGIKLLLNVKLPAGYHVQSDKPRDPLLVPTALTVKPPEGLKVDRIVYPAASDLAQPGRDKPLAVFGSEFTIEILVSRAPDGPTGEFVVPARFRYQACDASLCYPPATADVQWTLRLEKS